jgi:hypothetical protein
MAFMVRPNKNKGARQCSNCNVPMNEIISGNYVIYHCDRCEKEIKYKKFG